MKIEIVNGNMFDSTTKYICHQCNCISTKSAHLAQTVFSRYPYADIYTNRTKSDTPGTIIISGNGQDHRYVINMLAQYYPGSPRYPNSAKDGFQAREQYFKQCLNHICNIKNLESIAFPFKIGCGAAGGNWDNYFKILSDFADNTSACVLVFKIF